MKKKCSYTKKMIDLAEGDLSPDVKNELEAHIRQCDLCRTFLEEYKELETSLGGYRRPEAPRDIKKEYYAKLDRQFQTQPVYTALMKGIRSFLLHSRPMVRLAQAAGMLFIGISIGWILFRPSGDHSQPPVSVIRISPYSARQISTLFHESEMWLLDVMNLPQNGDLELQDWTMTREQAEQLLRRIEFIEEFDDAVPDKRIQGYLNGLEILLLEIMNGRQEDRSDIIRQIKQNIIELDLLFRVDILQQRMQMVVQQA